MSELRYLSSLGRVLTPEALGEMGTRLCEGERLIVVVSPELVTTAQEILGAAREPYNASKTPRPVPMLYCLRELQAYSWFCWAVE